MIINYVIASWGGKTSKRREAPLTRHLQQLNSLKCDLAQVTIGRPKCHHELHEYTHTVETIKQLEDGTPVAVLPLKNEGLSYGQWSRIFSEYEESFSHYIFIEDDYVPVRDHFDRWLVNRFDELHRSCRCGFLCGVVLNKAGIKPAPLHAAVSNGVTSFEVLKAVRDHHGCLPHDNQLTFSQAFTACGFSLCDYLDTFRCRYWPHTRKVRLFGDKNKPDLIDPIEVVE